MSHKPEIENHLADMRKARGLSAAEVAEIVGVSRQAIYSIEAGTYVPNTALSLRLAHVLAVDINDMFRLKTISKLEPKAAAAELVSPPKEVREGQPVQLARVDDRLVAVPPSPLDWYLPQSDAVVSGAPQSRGRVSVRPHAGREFSDRLVIAGCDPAGAILARHLHAAGVQTVLVHQNSSRALSLLMTSSVHIAGTHFHDADNHGANIAAVKKTLRGVEVAVIGFAVWQEGLITAPGNPKRIKSVQDLARKGIRFVNREPGAACRLLVDGILNRLQIGARQVQGYEREAPGHMAAARQVSRGKADCCVAAEPAARAFGLHFVPLQAARYDLAVRKKHLDLPVVRALLDTIIRGDFRRELEAAAGYETEVAGRRFM